MPEFFSTASGTVITSAGANPSTSGGTTLTAGATANTKGSAVELVPATPHDAHWIVIMLTNPSATTSFLVDLLAGDAPETPVVADLFLRTRGGNCFGPYLFPLFIPRGTRLAARCQAATASATVQISLLLIGAPALQGSHGASHVTGYGATAASQGTLVDPGATANVDSAWTEITPATAGDHHWLAISGYFGDGALAAATQWRLRVGGGDAPEAAIVEGCHVSADTVAHLPAGPVLTLPLAIPRQTRLTCSIRSSSGTAGDRAAYIRLYGC